MTSLCKMNFFIFLSIFFIQTQLKMIPFTCDTWGGSLQGEFSSIINGKEITRVTCKYSFRHILFVPDHTFTILLWYDIRGSYLEGNFKRSATFTFPCKLQPFLDGESIIEDNDINFTGCRNNICDMDRFYRLVI